MFSRPGPFPSRSGGVPFLVTPVDAPGPHPLPLVPMSSTSSAAVERTPAARLVRHSRRPSWGRGALVWERPAQRAYRFEDGRLRVFSRTQVGLLRPVDMETEEAQGVAEKLQGRRSAARSTSRNARKLPVPKGSHRVLAPQIKYFRERYPDGFTGDAWLKQHRGEGAGKRSQAHRDPAIEDMRKVLGARRLRRHKRAGRANAVHEELTEALSKTDLVPQGQLDRLLKAEPTDAWVEGLVKLTHFGQPLEERFSEWLDGLRSLGARVCTWELATAPLGLVRPDRHLVVRRIHVSRQLQRLDDGRSLGLSPDREDLEHINKVAIWVGARLRRAGLPPRDMLDILDFIQLTMAKDALEEIEGA